MRSLPRFSVFLLLLGLSSGRAGPSRVGKGLRLEDGSGSWRLSNGQIELAVDKQEAALTHLSVPGGPELISSGYYDTNGRPGGFAKSAGYLRFGHHEAVIAEIARQDEELIDLVLRTDAARLKPGFSHPLRTELHYVLRREEPGFYFYVLCWHTPDMPAFELVQTRHVIKGRRAVFDQWQITDSRKGTFPPEREVAEAKKVYDATFQLPDGRFMTKYANAVAAANHHLSGIYSTERQIGLWQINPSSAYINGGPTKQNLTIHPSVPYLLHMLHSGHFGGKAVRIEGAWCKVYGPVFFYVERGGSMADQWEDAKRRVRQEKSKWPYAWVRPKSVPDAFPQGRGSITGRLRRGDGKSSAGAMVVLGEAEPDWPFQGAGYLYWARVSEDGRFEMRHVRPGSYTAYAYQSGLFGQARVGGVVIRPGITTEMGTIHLEPKKEGRRVWQIGVPDRTAREYRHGDDFRQVYLHKRYPEEFPDDVRFVIGKSKEARDWNYYQPGDRTWRVVFRLSGAPAKESVLTIAIAGFSYSPPVSIKVALNGRAMKTLSLGRGDSALWRLGIYDVYRVEKVSIGPEKFKTGENILSLKLPHRRMWLMYDFLRLEARE